jgi:hypothetical protein
LTVKDLRPLARRRASTFRPFFVLMRDRKPWTLARRRFFGWNVLLGMYESGDLNKKIMPENAVFDKIRQILSTFHPQV